MSSLPTPCRGICSTGIGDSVCRGCKRFVHEVIAWQQYDPNQRRMIWQRLDHLLGQVLAQKVRISDQQTLEICLGKLHTKRYPERFWHELLALLELQAKASTGCSLADMGIALVNVTGRSLPTLSPSEQPTQLPDEASTGQKPPDQQHALKHLLAHAHTEFWQLSNAYYDLQFERAHAIARQSSSQ